MDDMNVNRTVHPGWKRILPEVLCPFCKIPMKELQVKDVRVPFTLAYVYSCKEFKQKELEAFNQIFPFTNEKEH